MKKLGLALLVGCCVTALACGDDDDAAASEGDGGSGKGGSSGRGGSGSTAGTGSSDEPFDPETCGPMGEVGSMLPKGCTQAEIDGYTDCITESCEPTAEECYGPDYRSGEYSGPCKENIECATEDCECGDSQCMQGCPGAAACGECFAANPCGTDCKIPSCAVGGALADAGIDIDVDKTCADVLKCCATLTGDQMTQCTEGVKAIMQAGGANADFGCAALLPAFAMGSSDPACM
jgi:hypothetical protein